MNFEKLPAGVRDAKRVSTHGNVTTAIISFGNFINLIKKDAARSAALKENYTIKKTLHNNPNNNQGSVFLVSNGTHNYEVYGCNQSMLKEILDFHNQPDWPIFSESLIKSNHHSQQTLSKLRDKYDRQKISVLFKSINDSKKIKYIKPGSAENPTYKISDKSASKNQANISTQIQDSKICHDTEHQTSKQPNSKKQYSGIHSKIRTDPESDLLSNDHQRRLKRGASTTSIDDGLMDRDDDNKTTGIKKSHSSLITLEKINTLRKISYRATEKPRPRVSYVKESLSSRQSLKSERSSAKPTRTFLPHYYRSNTYAPGVTDDFIDNMSRNIKICARNIQNERLPSVRLTSIPTISEINVPMDKCRQKTIFSHKLKLNSLENAISNEIKKTRRSIVANENKARQALLNLMNLEKLSKEFRSICAKNSKNSFGEVGQESTALKEHKKLKESCKKLVDNFTDMLHSNDYYVSISSEVIKSLTSFLHKNIEYALNLFDLQRDISIKEKNLYERNKIIHRLKITTPPVLQKIINFTSGTTIIEQSISRSINQAIIEERHKLELHSKLPQEAMAHLQKLTDLVNEISVIKQKL